MRKTLLLILLVVSLVAAACSSPTSQPEPTVDQQEIENSVNATLTAMAPAETPPPTEIAPPTEMPTSTLLPSPTPTATPTLTPTPELVAADPAQILGEPDAVDTFNTKTNWTLFDTECFKSEITDGMFVMTAKGGQGNICWEVSWPEYKDFYVDTMVFMPDDCKANDRFGLLYRAPDNDRGYLLGLSCDGKYSLTLWNGEKSTVLVEPTPSDVINVGLDAVNRLGVAAYGGVYHLYANGYYLIEVADNTYTGDGKFGYFVQTATDSGFVVEYDNLMVWQLEEEFIPPSLPAPPTTGILPTAAPGVPSVTATTYVKVRSGPASFYPVLIVAQQGATTEAVGVSTDQAWFAVSLPTSLIESGIGWVSAAFVTSSGTANLPVLPAPPPPPEIEPPPPGESDPTVTTIDAVNIRSGPSNQCASYGVPPIGTVALAIGISADNGWYTIRIPTDISSDGIGWVNAKYVTAKNTANLPVMESQLCP